MENQDVKPTPPNPEINQQPIVEPTQQPSNKPNKLLVPLLLVVILVLLASTGFFAYQYFGPQQDHLQTNSQKNTPQSSPKNQTNRSIPNTPQPTPALSTDLPETKSIDTLNASAGIKVPFIRYENLYLYEDGEQKLVAQPQQKTTSDSCYFLQYPQISSDGNYVAYIEQVGAESGYGDCMGGVLRVLDINTNKIVSAGFYSYRGGYFWRDNQLHIRAQLPELKFHTVIYNPKNNEVVLNVQTDVSSDLDVKYHPYNQNKVLVQEGDTFSLTDSSLATGKQIIQNNDIDRFRGWSPNGRYALFETQLASQNSDSWGSLWYAIDTFDNSFPINEVIVEQGAAGGSFSVGTQWYFDKGFVTYCSESLSNIDGSEPTKLTESGGGGCHNEGGFVATSPNEQYAFVKYTDRFEIHSASGDKTKVVETTAINKGRGTPKNFRWIGNDYLILFETIFNPHNYGEGSTAFVHLFDRNKNQITPLIDDAYLVETQRYE